MLVKEKKNVKGYVRTLKQIIEKKKNVKGIIILTSEPSDKRIVRLRFQ
jgi:hypothetical protein